MISSSERQYIEAQAYLPEHLVSYVTAVRPLEPLLIEDFVAYRGQAELVFVGYPLEAAFSEARLQRAFAEAKRRFKPRVTALIAPALPAELKAGIGKPSDHYYKLDLSTPAIPPKTRNMIQRAKRELVIRQIKDPESDHEKLILSFMESRPLNEASRLIFPQIPHYVRSSPGAFILEARNGQGELVAFDVADFSAKNWAMYMFNITSQSAYIPGASDLLLAEIVRCARTENKTALNLGLGINSGVTFFKKKWGGTPFLPYFIYTSEADVTTDLLEMLQRL